MSFGSKKETKRKARQRKSWIGFYLGRTLFILLGMIFLAVGLIALICREKEVRVEGSEIYSRQEIIDRVLDDKLSRSNTVYALIKNALMPKKNIPFIDRARVRLNSPGRITIELKQTPMTGYFLLNDGTNRAYFGDKGLVTDVSALVIDGVPSLSGITADKVGIGDKIPARDQGDRETILSVFRFFADKSIAIKDLKLEEDGRLHVACRNIDISLGTKTNLRDKLKRVPYLLDKIGDMSGTLHLENWTPDNTDVIFEKDQAQMEREQKEGTDKEAETKSKKNH